MLQRFRFLFLAAVIVAGGVATGKGVGAQTPPRPNEQKNEETRPVEPKNEKPGKGVKEPSGEQLAEWVVFVYGSRQGMAQIQKSGLERGRITRTNNEGRPEEISYERRFMRGESSEKDKIRLEQKTPSAEYALIYNSGRIWGMINGSTFTPRQETVTDFLSTSRHGIGALLRYKENGASVQYAGKDKQKNIEMWILDLVDKDKSRTRYYISSQKLRILWLEYEEPVAGAAKPVQFRRTFHDYRYAQGQLVPFRSVLYADGKQLEETTVLNVSFGLKMDESVFGESQTNAASAQ